MGYCGQFPDTFNTFNNCHHQGLLVDPKCFSYDFINRHPELTTMVLSSLEGLVEYDQHLKWASISIHINLQSWRGLSDAD